MHVTGIIAEYNPFHNGHSYQLAMVKQHFPDTHVIAVLSGSFTQRGEIALLDKWERASLAVQNGCDLVLELPASYAVRSAQDFARGGIRLLSSLGIVNALAFGTELASPEALFSAASLMDSGDVQALLRQRLQEGLSYANALCHALSVSTGLSEDSLRQPNTILAMEYLRAWKTYPSSPPMQPLPLPRKKAHHNDPHLSNGFSSAQSIREELAKKEPDWQTIQSAVPHATFQSLKHIKEQGLPDRELLFRPLLSKLLCMDSHAFQIIYGINEGLEHRLLKAMRQAKDMQSLIQLAVSPRYPKSRIQRLIFYLLLGFTKAHASQADASGPLYARVLALNQRGRTLIRNIQQVSEIPIITRLSPHLDSRKLLSASSLLPYQQQLATDVLATGLRGLSLSPVQTILPDFTTSPIYHE